MHIMYDFRYFLVRVCRVLTEAASRLAISLATCMSLTINYILGNTVRVLRGNGRGLALRLRGIMHSRRMLFNSLC